MPTRIFEAPAAALVTGSELMVVTGWQVRGYEQAIASEARDHQQPPHGWDRHARCGVVQLALTAAAEIPVLVGHDLDSAGQPWLHTHVIYGALARADPAGRRWDYPSGPSGRCSTGSPARRG